MANSQNSSSSSSSSFPPADGHRGPDAAEVGAGAVSEMAVRLDSADGAGGAAVFQPGQMVTGRVRLRLLRPLTLRNLDLLVQGSGTVGWGQGGGHFVRDDEVYVNDMAELVATGLGEVVTLSAGEHVFPFACTLPDHLPATFSGSYGSVAYAAKAVMQADGGGAGGPWIASAPFAVESQLRLADHAAQLSPCVVEARMLVGSGGPAARGRCVKASLSLPRRVFATQEDVVMTASVANRSRKTIARLTAGLVMDCLYQAGGQQQFRESLLVSDRVDEYRISHMEGRCWKNVRLRIPRLVPPSGLPHCRLASVSYALVFRAEVENCAKDLNIRVPIVVGVALPEGTAAEDGGDSAAADPAGHEEPEVMRPLSTLRSGSNNFDSLSDSSGMAAGSLRGQKSQRPKGSTEKRPCSDYYIVDPAGAAATSSTAEEGAAVMGGFSGRYLPPDVGVPTDGGDDLY